MKKLFFITLVLIISCKEKGVKNEKADNPRISELKLKLDSLFRAEISDNEPGAAFLVSFKGEKLISKGYGLRDLENNLPITPETNLRLASVSKQFTALAILSLVNDGKLKLDDSVYNYLPYDSFKGITIEQLINHTSGLLDAEEAFFNEWDSNKVATNDDIVEWYKIQNRKDSLVREDFKYNNGIYEVIPVIVEKVSGLKFAEYSKQMVFNKMDMATTNCFDLLDPIEIPQRAMCYSKDSIKGWKKVDGHFLNGLLGAGGVYTNLNDYFEYDNHLRSKDVFSEEIHDIIFQKSSSETYEGEKYYYGMGWFVGDSTVDHSGGWFGANTYVKRYMNTPLTFAIFMNRDNLNENRIVQKTDSILIKYLFEPSN